MKKGWNFCAEFKPTQSWAECMLISDNKAYIIVHDRKVNFCQKYKTMYLSTVMSSS